MIEITSSFNIQNQIPENHGNHGTEPVQPPIHSPVQPPIHSPMQPPVHPHTHPSVLFENLSFSDSSQSIFSTSRIQNLSSKRVYLDHNASTPLHPNVIKKLTILLQEPDLWGNPSSIHKEGQNIKPYIREARQQIAQALKISPLELIFTSGASESNSLLIHIISTVLRSKYPHKNEIITSTIEHPSLAKGMDELSEHGFIVHKVPVDRRGVLNMEDYISKLSPKTLLVSIMYVHNETGVLLPLQKLIPLAKDYGALFHSDMVQAYGKIGFSLDLDSSLNLDYASFSGHKFYALKGCGVFFIRKTSPFQPLIFGGGQERGRRGGTENVLGIISMGETAKLLPLVSENYKRISQLRDTMEERILSEIPNVKITGMDSKRVPNTSSLIIEGVDGETLLMSLDLLGFSVSTGAACSSGASEPSPSLRAMGLSLQEAQSSLRISLGWDTLEEDLNSFVIILKKEVHRLRTLDLEWGQYE